jgi:hypothetical protein
MPAKDVKHKMTPKDVEQMVMGSMALGLKAAGARSQASAARIACTLIQNAVELEAWDLFEALQTFAPQSAHELYSPD